MVFYTCGHYINASNKNVFNRSRFIAWDVKWGFLISQEVFMGHIVMFDRYACETTLSSPYGSCKHLGSSGIFGPK